MIYERRRQAKLVAFILYPFVVIFTYRFAPFEGFGLFEFAEYFAKEISEKPFRFTYSSNFWKALPMVTMIYAFIVLIYISSMKNTRYGEEFGSARWASVGEINRKFKTIKEFYEREIEFEKEIGQNPLMEMWQSYILFSSRLRVSILSNCDNINTLVLGGPGTGKSRTFIIPNIMQLNSNIVVTDPKGEILAKVGNLLKMAGYDIRILDLKNPYKSWGYNPFKYFRNDDDIFKFVKNMWEAMSNKTAQKGEQIWDDQAKNMLTSIMLYLYYYAPIEEQNFDMVLEIMSIIDSSEETAGKKNLPKPHEILFDRIPHNSSAYKYFSMWNSAKGRTLSSIVATLSAKMAIFSLPSMRKLTYYDEMNILDLATKKVAVFMLLPDDNNVYNFLAGTLYSQMFQQLYDYADNVIVGPLPRHVRFYMDEFANIALPDDYKKILSTSRSRNVSFIIVLQDKAQIEAMYEKDYRTIMADCAFKLFLGSYEPETCKYYSEMLGKETVTVITHNISYGIHGNTTKNENLQARDLLSPDELRTRLGRRNCILYAEDQYAVKDMKNDMTRHKYYKYIADGPNKKKNLFSWDGTDNSSATIEKIDSDYKGKITPLSSVSGNWKLMSMEEIEEIIAS